jgi:hypothetical protein
METENGLDFRSKRQIGFRAKCLQKEVGVYQIKQENMVCQLCKCCWHTDQPEYVKDIYQAH